tara:strand:- start:438 stop:605 length:168 start_codon:yes stop_codon:yes gene_type:complete
MFPHKIRPAFGVGAQHSRAPVVEDEGLMPAGTAMTMSVASGLASENRNSSTRSAR